MMMIAIGTMMGGRTAPLGASSNAVTNPDTGLAITNPDTGAEILNPDT